MLSYGLDWTIPQETRLRGFIMLSAGLSTCWPMRSYRTACLHSCISSYLSKELLCNAVPCRLHVDQQRSESIGNYRLLIIGDLDHVLIRNTRWLPPTSDVLFVRRRSTTQFRSIVGDRRQHNWLHWYVDPRSCVDLTSNVANAYGDFDSSTTSSR